MSLCSMHHARIKAGIFSQKMDQIASNTMDNFVEKAPCVILQPDSNYSTVHYIKGEISSLFLTVYIAHLKQDDIYHITVLKDNVKIGQVPLFLTIPLFEQPNGELRYHIKSKQRHEIYVRSHDGREKTIIFKLPEYFAAQVFTKKVSSILTYLKKKKIITEFRVFEEESSKRKYSECEPDTSEILMLAPPSPCTITMATTGINGGTNNSFLQQKHSIEELQEIVKLLSAAIEIGDIENAKTLTGSLAAARAKVKIDIESVDRIFGDTFPLTVQIEDRQGHSTVKLQVTASDTIRDLKNKFLFKYQFPVEVQRWVVGKKLPPDNETLSQHKIRGPGNTAYVYLVTAKSAMSEPTYQHQQSSSSSQRSLSSGSAYMDMSLTQQSQQSIRPSRQSGNFVRGSSSENPYTNMQATSNLRTSNSQASINDGGYEIFEPFDNSPQAAAVPVFAATVPAAPAAHAPMSTSTPVGAVRKTSEEKKKTVGWECPACTYINMPTRPGCEICSTTKPDTYEMPDNYVLTAEELQRIQEEEDIERHMREQEEQERLDRLTALLLTDDIDLIANTEEFVCPVCFDTIEVGDGVVLRECLHNFCRECLMSVAQHTEIAELHCPFQDNTYKCESIIQEREIRALVNDQIYQQILQRSLTTAESQEINSYHCATTDCPGWCIYEDLVNFFLCPVCTKENCLTCKATHEGMNCLQYQNDVRIRATNDSAMKKTKEYLDLMVDQGNAMHCPQCQIIVMKKDGCDWIKCSCCKTEICWVTKGRRWGLNGQGDTSGGCRCNVNGKRCHADCANCH